MDLVDTISIGFAREEYACKLVVSPSTCFQLRSCGFFLRLVNASAEESNAGDPVQSPLLIGHHNTVEIRHLFERSGQQMSQTLPNKK